MYRRDQHINIPTEVLRTLSVIVDTGSFTKAAQRLGLSQPGISAQIKRLQVLVGGSVFERNSSGVTLTERGKLLLPLIRRLLEANDQILGVGGAAKDPRPLRLGLGSLYAKRVGLALGTAHQDAIHVYCDQSDEIAKGLGDGYIDIGCLLKPPQDAGRLVSTWQEEFVWVRSPELVVNAGLPIPLIGWPGFLSDRLGIDALQANGQAYRMVFVSSDSENRLAAAASGLGLMVASATMALPSVVRANEYFLPPLPPMKAGICVREGFESKDAEPLLAMLKHICATDSRRAERITAHA